METQNQIITVETTVNAPVEKVWEYWTGPRHVEKWNFATDEWHNPHAENDLRVGGQFIYRMEAKDGSFGFDFDGCMMLLKKMNTLNTRIGDGTKSANIFFSE